jgi:hypothetical protein
MLEPYRGQDERVAEVLDRARSQIKGRYSRDKLERILERERGSLHVVLLTAQIQSGIEWVYRAGTST